MVKKKKVKEAVNKEEHFPEDLKRLMIMIAVAFMFLMGVAYYVGIPIPQDSAPEEIFEEVLELQTGVEIDLSPMSPEQC